MQPPKSAKRVLSSKQKLQHNFSLGEQGEQRAVEFLQKKNFQVLTTNFRAGNQEIDIIALDLGVDELVFIEVKTRSQDFSGNPSGAVGYLKLKSMKRAAAAYLRSHPQKELLYQKDYRFDIIAILPNSVDHYQNVTWGMVK